MPTLRFKPLPEITERLSFTTDVVRTFGAEMRTSGNELRTQVVYRFSQLDDDYAVFEEELRDNLRQDWEVPLWHERTRNLSLTAGQTVLMVDTDADYQAGGQAIVWRGCNEFELVAIDSVGVGTITLGSGLLASYSGAAVMPVHTCFIRGDVQRVKSQRGVMSTGINFEYRLTEDLAASPWGTYSGDQILGCSVALISELSGVIGPRADYFDSGLGPVELIPNREFDDFVQAAEVTGHAWDLKRFLHQIRGRAEQFWVRSWGGNLRVSAALASDTTIGVTTSRPMTDFVGRHVYIDGVYREITAAAAGILTLDSALGQDVASGAPASLLSLVRSDTDSIEIQHGLVTNRSQFPVLEVSTGAFSPLPDPLGPANILFLANFEGSNGDTAYTEESQFAAAMTAGTGHTISTFRSKFGLSSLSGTGLYFSGANFPKSIDYSVLDGLTVEGHCYVTATGSSWGHIIGDREDDGGNEGGAFYLRQNAGTANATLSFFTTQTGTGSQTYDATGVLPFNAWNHYYIEFDFVNLTVQAWFNGSLSIDSTLPGQPSNAASTLNLGSANPSGFTTRRVLGNHDSVRIANRLVGFGGTVPTTRLRSTFTETRV